jgi:hypothetical protein
MPSDKSPQAKRDDLDVQGSISSALCKAGAVHTKQKGQEKYKDCIDIRRII